MEREILGTGELAQFDWPASFYLQGGKYAAVRPDSNGSLVLSYVEVFPTTPRTFLRREGFTLVEAERACWEAWLAIEACPYHPVHGPFVREGYTNGSGICEHCRGWFGPEITGFKPMPAVEDLVAGPEALERFMLTGRWEAPGESEG